MRQRSQDSLNTAEKKKKSSALIHPFTLIFIHGFKVSFKDPPFTYCESFRCFVIEKSKWQRVSSLSNLPASTVLLLNKSNNGKKRWLPLEPKDFESQRSCSFRWNDNGFEVRWEHLLCACLRCFTHLCVHVCVLSASSVSHCFRQFVFTLSYIPTRLFTNRNHGNMSVLICSPDSICHHQSSTASSLHLERKRDGNQRRHTWQWGFQQKALHQSNGASCVIKNTKLPSVTGCKWSALVKTRC